jgi:hypothetical protein
MLVGLLSCFWEQIGSRVGTPRVTSPKVAFSGADVEAVDEALLDSGCDVAVDAADPGQPVAESLGLCDLRDAVLNHPGLVSVPEIVEVHARDHRCDQLLRVAVGGRSPETAAEVGPSEEAAIDADEDVRDGRSPLLTAGDPASYRS